MIEVVLTPSHLTGARVENVMMEPGHLPSVYPNGEKKILILDRPHPTQEGRIAIAEEDCTTHFVLPLTALHVGDVCPVVAL